MMKEYIKPQSELIELQSEDTILTVSGGMEVSIQDESYNGQDDFTPY